MILFQVMKGIHRLQWNKFNHNVSHISLHYIIAKSHIFSFTCNPYHPATPINPGFYSFAYPFFPVPTWSSVLVVCVVGWWISCIRTTMPQPTCGIPPSEARGHSGVTLWSTLTICVNDEYDFTGMQCMCLWCCRGCVPLAKAFEDYRLESFKRKDVHPDVQLQ